MRNPNEVTRTTRTTSTSFVQIYGFVNARVAERNMPEYKTTFAQVSGSTVEQVGKTIVVTQPIWKEG